MRVCGCITLLVNILDNVINNYDLRHLNLYELCTDDLKYRIEAWDNETLFDDYFRMYDFILKEENISEKDDEIGYDRVEELCDYIKKSWLVLPPTIMSAEFGQLDDEGWVDTVYIIDCDYEEVYRRMKAKGESI